MGSTDGHQLADENLDAELLELLLRIVPQVLLEHREELGRGLDQDDPGFLLRHARVILGEALAVELDQRAGALDSRRPAAYDDDVERPVFHQRRIPVGRLPGAQDVLLEAHGVGQRVHRERVLGSAGRSEEGDLGSEGEHQVVVVERLHLGKLDLPRVEVDPGDGRLVDGGVRLLVEQVAERVPDDGRLEQVGRELVEERLERVVVVRVYDHDVGLDVLQRAGGADPGEAAAEDDDARPPLACRWALWTHSPDLSRASETLCGRPISCRPAKLNGLLL